MPGIGTLIDMTGIVAGGAAALTTTGSVMILCIGINLIWNKEIRVANMLPMIIIGVLISYVPGLQ